MASEQVASYVPWLRVGHGVARLGLISTFIFCYALIYLTVFHVKRNFGQYKKVMLLSPVLGIIFACMEFMLVPFVHSYNAGLLYFCSSVPFFLSPKAVEWLSALYTGIYATSIATIANQFVYRYWAVFNERKLIYFKGYYYLIFIFYALYFGFQYALGVFYFMEIDDYSRSYLRNDVLHRYDIHIDNLIGKAIVAYDEEGNVRWWNVFAILDMASTVAVQYLIIIYCAVKMHLKMEEKLKLVSTSIRNLHKQMFKTLVLQISAPTVFLFSPVVVTIFLPLFDVQISLPSGCYLTSFSLYPAMDAIIIMSIVKDYQKCVLEILKGMLEALIRKMKTTEVSTTGHQTMEMRVQTILSP